MQKYLLSVLLFSLTKISPAIAKCIYGDCTNGKGIYLYSDGSKYTGNFYQNIPSGEGIYRHTDGSIYEGTFKNGIKNGFGKLSFAGGDVYSGNFENGVIAGKGSIRYRNGDMYAGQWVNGRANGMGTYIFSEGDTYIGNFLDGSFTGHGKLTRKNGSYFDGNWARNKKHGSGITFTNGSKKVQYFEMNTLISEKPYDGDQISSPFISKNKTENSNDIKDCTSIYCDNEVGMYTYGDGSVYSGPFINGQGEGDGECVYINGDKYTGGWKNHGPHGKGTMHFKSGNTYTAIWEYGKPKQRLGATKVSEAYSDNKRITATTEKPPVEGSTKIFALIVGVATYNHMPSLKYTDDDAYLLYAFLKSPEGGALPDDQIKILIDEGATQQTILNELKQLATIAGANDVIMLYLSGHGIDGAFVPSDFDGYNNRLTYEEILSVLNGSKAKHKLFIADACHSGSMMVAARTPLNISLENFYGAYNASAGGTAILMSSKKEEMSLEYGGLRQGVFSHFLVKGLKGFADFNKDKLITIMELHTYINSQVKSYTGNIQNPSITGDYDKNMPVAMIR
ncbi:MAG: caspase family protein [Saprospiraceae bacterium]|jgi:hypothetical protein|nr:caspase family protein [Saprospiraceae bacterium]